MIQDDREINEVIIVCLDVSYSMNGDSFKEEELQANEKEETEPKTPEVLYCYIRSIDVLL